MGYRDDNNNNVKNVRLKKSHDTMPKMCSVFDSDYMRVLKSRVLARRVYVTRCVTYSSDIHSLLLASEHELFKIVDLYYIVNHDRCWQSS